MSLAQGAFAVDQPMPVRELRFVELAARQQWPFPQNARAEVINRIVAIIVDASKPAREVIAAARVLLDMSKFNLQSVAQMLKAEENEAGHPRVAVLEPAQLAAPTGNEPLAIGRQDTDGSSDAESSAVAGPEPTVVAAEADVLAAVSNRSSAVAAETSERTDRSPAIGHQPASEPATAADSSAPARSANRSVKPRRAATRPQETPAEGLEYVTHLELFAEDPSPSAPAIERLSKARMRFRVGNGVNLWVDPPALRPLLTPGPERDLLLNHRMQICRVDDPSRYEPD